MNVIAINGSPRKDGNTATLLKKALDGAASRGAETELVNLYDLDYKGCISCFNCKLKGGKSLGQCAVKDGLKPVLERMDKADAIILGSPIYFGQTTGMMRSFLERLLFQYLQYDANYSSLFEGKLPVGFIYTMNVNDEQAMQYYAPMLKVTEGALERTFGPVDTLYATYTYQFDDYAKYETSGMDEKGRAQRRKEVFPLDCQKAFDMGAGFAGRGIA